MLHRIIQLIFVFTFLGVAPAAAGQISGTVTDKNGDPVGGALVYVDSIPGARFVPPTEHAVVDQRSLLFYPHVLPVLVGTVVDFRNSDLLLHNVFSPAGCDDGFQLGTWPRGESRSYTFDEPCTAVVLCNLHPEMEAYVVVVQTPYFALTEDDGRYRIEGVPDGNYTLRIWHERLRPETQPVTVSGRAVARRDFRFEQ